MQHLWRWTRQFDEPRVARYTVNAGLSYGTPLSQGARRSAHGIGVLAITRTIVLAQREPSLPFHDLPIMESDWAQAKLKHKACRGALELWRLGVMKNKRLMNTP
jgi:hypothetical protein